MKAKTKKKLRKHVKRRVQERYGILLNDQQITDIENKIRSGKSRLVHAQSRKNRLHVVEFDLMTLPVVYDNQRGCLITVFPPETLDEWRQKYGYSPTASTPN